DAPQVVTVTGVDDDDADGSIDYRVENAVVISSDARYDGIDPTDVLLTNIDNDTAGITVNPTSGLVTNEGGGEATFTVVLHSRPSADVTIAVSSSRPSEGTVDVSSLVFTPTNWSAPRTVTVRGENDDIAD